MGYGKISKKQSEILAYIKSQIINKGYPPSVRDICEAVQLKSTSSVHDSFNSARRGEVVNVPVVGRVAAGEPILAVENVESYFPVPMEFMPNEQCFMLQVKGESMINAGIFDGDTILVEQCQTASNGDMVVALINDSATVKTFYREADHIRLQPENDTMDPIIVPDCQILGKVFGVFRFFR